MIKLMHLVYVVLVTWISDTKWKDESKHGWNTDVTSKMDPEQNQPHTEKKYQSDYFKE